MCAHWCDNRARDRPARNHPHTNPDCRTVNKSLHACIAIWTRAKLLATFAPGPAIPSPPPRPPTPTARRWKPHKSSGGSNKTTQIFTTPDFTDGPQRRGGRFPHYVPEIIPPNCPRHPCGFSPRSRRCNRTCEGTTTPVQSLPRAPTFFGS